MCFRNLILLIFSAVLCLINQTHCLYEDEVGKFDWRIQFIGNSKFTAYDVSSGGGRRILLATEQNVLASVNSRSGDLVWRQVFENKEDARVDDMLHSGNYVVVVLGGGLYVRCFSTVLGDLMWETSIPNADPSHIGHVARVEGDSVAVMSGTQLSMYSSDTGYQLWAVDLPERTGLEYWYVTSSDDRVTVLGVMVGSHLTIQPYDDSGSSSPATDVSAPWLSQQTSCVIVSKHLVCVDPVTLTLYTLSINNPSTFTAQLLQELGVAGLDDVSLTMQGAAHEGYVAIQGGAHHGGGLALLQLEPGEGRLKLVKYCPAAIAGTVSAYSEATLLVTLEPSITTNNLASMRTYDISTGNEVGELTQAVAYPEHHGGPERLTAYLYKRKDGVTGLRLLVQGRDASLTMIQHTGRVSWTREEALSTVLSAEMVDLPVSPILAKMEEEFGTAPGSPREPAAARRSSPYDILGMFIKRFTTQAMQLQEYLLELRSSVRLPRGHGADMSDMDDAGMIEDDPTLDPHYLTRDDFNLHKMIVVVTEYGKLYGIDSFTGHIMWRILVSGLQPFTSSSSTGGPRLPLYVLRTTAHFPLTPICTVIGLRQSTGEPMLFTFDPISGEAVEGMTTQGRVLGHTVKQVYQLSHTDDSFIRPLVLMDESNKYHVVPSGDAEFVASLTSELFMFTVDRETSSLTGYNMQQYEGELVGSEVWHIQLNHDGHVIKNVATKRALEHVHSQGVVLGDRSVLYKYINPNLIVVTTEAMAAQDKPGADSLSIYLIDAVSGAVIFHCNHKKSRGPVQVVHSENWVLYNYWNVKKWRTEMAVIELYEGSNQSNATAFSSLSPPSLPLVMRQAFIFPSHITTMTSTLTEKGMTNKQVIMALETGGILGLPKMLLDPRRPIVPTAEHKEEGILPYMPELPRPFEATINYNQSIANIRGLHTAPAGLESTSLILAFGLDLYYTRVSPSKLFDVLKDDFDYFFIATVLAAMIAVSVISRKLSARKALNRVWK